MTCTAVVTRLHPAHATCSVQQDIWRHWTCAWRLGFLCRRRWQSRRSWSRCVDQLVMSACKFVCTDSLMSRFAGNIAFKPLMEAAGSSKASEDSYLAALHCILRCRHRRLQVSQNAVVPRLSHRAWIQRRPQKRSRMIWCACWCTIKAQGKAISPLKATTSVTATATEQRLRHGTALALVPCVCCSLLMCSRAELLRTPPQLDPIARMPSAPYMPDDEAELSLESPPLSPIAVARMPSAPSSAKYHGYTSAMSRQSPNPEWGAKRASISSAVGWPLESHALDESDWINDKLLSPQPAALESLPSLEVSTSYSASRCSDDSHRAIPWPAHLPRPKPGLLLA